VRLRSGALVGGGKTVMDEREGLGGKEEKMAAPPGKGWVSDRRAGGNGGNFVQKETGEGRGFGGAGVFQGRVPRKEIWADGRLLGGKRGSQAGGGSSSGWGDRKLRWPGPVHMWWDPCTEQKNVENVFNKILSVEDEGVFSSRGGGVFHREKKKNSKLL